MIRRNRALIALYLAAFAFGLWWPYAVVKG
jgi:hypothetical protein